MIDRKNLLLYAITDRDCLNGRDIFEAVEAALSGGVCAVQLREKNMNDADFIKEAIQMKKLCQKYNVPLIINDNVRVCSASGADGVHLGQNDMPAGEARKILGSSKIIGVTAKTISQAVDAEQSGADYLGSGAIFGTSTKKDAIKMDMETLKNICRSVKIPVVAIGGITADNVQLLNGSGIAGAAVVSGIFAQQDIKSACENLYKKICLAAE